MKPYTYNQTITQLFEEAVSIYPNNILIYLDKVDVTYKKFNEDTNQIAHYLRTNGVTRNLIVGVEMSRSYEMLCAIFAIMKAGGAYLPISPDYPDKRKKQMIQDAQIKFLITDTSHKPVPQDLYGVLKLPGDEISGYSRDNLISVNEPQDIAYVLYTSGSTGNPKGVMIAHHSLVNRLEWMQDQFPLCHNDILFQKTHCGFDVSIWELFWWSITGAGLTLLPSGKEDDIILMFKTIVEKKVTVIHFVPTVFKIFLQYLEIGGKSLKLGSLKFIFCSGEALDVSTVNHFNRLFHSMEYPQLVNLYGPTEATIDVAYFICDKKMDYQEIPIGKPIYNVELMVFDEFFNPRQPEQIGELYISGVCLALGYLNNAEQTKNCFLQHPENSNKLMYKTGDLVKWNSKGELCYVGRKDHQVKINGIRIELGEIENHIEKYENIAHAVVLPVSLNDTMKKLVAFIKLKDRLLVFDSSGLKFFLKESLPDYMIPHDDVFVEDYPLKESGKLDRKKLMEMYQKRSVME